MFFAHVYRNFRPKVINITRVGTDKNQDFIGWMDMPPTLKGLTRCSYCLFAILITLLCYLRIMVDLFR
jgi:hypothetical protein